jgi:hypothetical protein
MAWHNCCAKPAHEWHILAYIERAIPYPLIMADSSAPDKSKRIHLRLDRELYELIAERAKEENRSVTNMIATYLSACIGLPSSVVVERLNITIGRTRTRRKSK